MEKKLLFAALLAAIALTSNAQTDVTATYLENSDFEEGPVITADIRGYGKDMTDGDVYGYQDVNGWSYEITNSTSDQGYEGSGIIGAVLAYGSTNQMKGNNVSAPSNGYTDTSEAGLALLGIWGCGGYYYQEVTFPAGKYTINIPVYNISGANAVTSYFGFLADNGTTYYASQNSFTVGEWNELSVTFSLAEETSGRISVGYKSNGNGSGANPHLVVDYVQVYYTATVVKDALENAIAAIEALNAVWADDDIATEITEVQALLAKEDATQDEINAAVENIEAIINGTVCDYYIPAEYFNNMGFEDCTAETTDFGIGGSANSADYSEFGWANTQNASWCASAVVEYGGEGMVNHAPAPGTGESAKALGISVGWNGTVTYRNGLYFLPAGSYTITVNVYNANSGTQFNSKNGFVAEDGTTYLSTATSFPANEWTTDEIKFTLDKGVWGYIQVGGTANYATSTNHAIAYFDDITVEWSDPLEEAYNEYNAAKAAAMEAIDNSECATGEDYFILNDLIEASTPETYEDLVAGTQALKDATAAFLDAAQYIIALDEEAEKARSLGVDYDIINNYLPGDDITKAEAISYTQELKVAEYNYVTENFPYSVDLGTWVGSGEGTKPAFFSNEHWSGEVREYCNQDDSNGQGWNANAWTLNYEQTLTLPAGTYIFKVAGRQANSDDITLRLSVSQYGDEIGFVDDFPKKGNKARGITTDGAAGFSDDLTFANGGNGYGWEWRYVKFELSGTEQVTIAVEAIATAPHMWASFGDATLQSSTPTLVIDENEDEFTLAEEGTYNVVLNRTIKADVNSLILPFYMSMDEVHEIFGENAKVYQLYAFEIDDISGGETLSFGTYDGIEANVPCLLKTDEAGTSYNIFGRFVEPVDKPYYMSDSDNAYLIGNYKAMNVPQSNEALDLSGIEESEGWMIYLGQSSNYVISNGKSYIVNSDDAYMKLTRAYISIPGYDGDAKTISISLNDGTTGIMDVATGEVTTGHIYDLSGRVVKTPAKGLYIIDGKKVMIK